MKDSNQNGKGSSPRSCFSQKFRENHSAINWRKRKANTLAEVYDKISELPCFKCDGAGKEFNIYTMRYDGADCDVCKGKKSLSPDVWREKLKESVDKDKNKA